MGVRGRMHASANILKMWNTLQREQIYNVLFFFPLAKAENISCELASLDSLAFLLLD